MTNPLKNFSFENVIRHTSPDIMQLLLEERGVVSACQFTSLSELRETSSVKNYAQTVATAIQDLPESQRLPVERAFERIYLLTRDSGRVLSDFLRRGHLENRDIHSVLEGVNSLYDKAVTIWIAL